jgi:uncharacterized surface protein with fasciclin (FAS1) repeats
MKTHSLFFALLIPAVISCDRDIPEVFYQEGLVEIADYIMENKEEYSRFHDLMIAGDLTSPLNSYNPSGNGYTLFLPSDDAFNRYVEKKEEYSSFNELIQDEEFMMLLGRYHVVTGSYRSNEFPYGALPDSTGTGDYLTIGFSSNIDTTVYKINNVSPVVLANLEMLNGYIHVVGEVLEPVTYTGYDWLEQNPGYSIMTEALKLTGLSDTLGDYRQTSSNRLVKNQYTLLVEHDSIYRRNGINSINDLVNKYNTPGLEYSDFDNLLYQFTAYHIMEGSYFLADFQGSGNYNTYGTFPVSIHTGLDIIINPAVDTFAIEISPRGDTTIINYISMHYQESNIVTKTGAVHFLTQVMEPYRPKPSTRTFSFYEEPEINKNRNNPGSYELADQEKMEVLSWTGPESIIYYKSSSSSEKASGRDYLLIEGEFNINYIVPKILPGRYGFYIRAGTNSSDYPTIQIFIDGNRIGSNLDLTSAAEYNPYSHKWVRGPYAELKVASVDFSKYTEHTVTVKSLIRGIFLWDYVRFYPE